VGGVWEATFDLAAFGAHVENLTTDQRDVNRQRQILTDLLDADFPRSALLRRMLLRSTI
jgi:hypothetical protein